MDYVLHSIFGLIIVIYAFNLYNYYIKRYNVSMKHSDSLYSRWIDLQLSRKYTRVREMNENTSVFIKTKADTREH